MYCNMDLIRDVMGPDATAPKTWAELEAIAAAYKAKYDKPTYSHDIGGGYFAYYVTSVADSEYFNKAGTGACMDINDGWKVALTNWRKYIDNGWYMVPSLSTSGQWAEFKLGNLPISFASTGYVLNHNALADLPVVQEKRAAEPSRKVAYDQLSYVNETYVSIYTAEIDLEVVDALKAFAMDNLTVEEGYAGLKNIMESIFPDSVVEVYE